MGDRLRAGLEALKEKFPGVIGDVRGMGLMQAIELVVDEQAGDRTPNPAFRKIRSIRAIERETGCLPPT